MFLKSPMSTSVWFLIGPMHILRETEESEIRCTGSYGVASVGEKLLTGIDPNTVVIRLDRRFQARRRQAQVLRFHRAPRPPPHRGE